MGTVVALILAASFGLLLSAVPALAELYGRCELANALKDNGIAARDIPTWVCIGERLSSIQTDTITDPEEDPDGTSYHGVFLISDRWWCEHEGSRGKGCGVSCRDMRQTLDSNIKCAKKVFAETRRTRKDGFLAWGASYEDCRNPASYVRGCEGIEQPEDQDDGGEVDLAANGATLRSGLGARARTDKDGGKKKSSAASSS